MNENPPADDRIVLTESLFAELAHGRASPAAVRRLRDGQWSRRLLMLLLFRDVVVADSSLIEPLPPFEASWDALEQAQRAAPDAVAGLIMHPQVGNWLAYVLRRHRQGARSAAPMRVDIGQFHALALAAAATARQPYVTELPLRNGHVMIPGLGMARFEGTGAWGTVAAGTGDGRLWFRHRGDRIEIPPAGDSAGDTGNWWPLRQVTVGTELRLTVRLDDLDPMRDLADPVPPARLDPAAAARWAELLDGAWAVLVQNHREVAEAMAVGVTSFVPLPAGDGWDTRSASTGEAFGAIMCSPPPDAETLAVSLAHEFMHILLGGLMHLVPLTSTAGTPSLYAPWRDDPRPAGGLLQGVYAFFGIAAFWRKQPGTPQNRFEYAYSRMQTEEGLRTIREAGGLTERGFAFTDGIAAELRDWAAEDSAGLGQDEATALAGLVADSHRAGWRIRHFVPDPADVARLAAAWPHEAGTAGPPTVRPDPEMKHWSPARLGLARRRLIAADRGPDLARDGWAAGLTDADVALFAGDAGTAAEGFAGQLAADPTNLDAWTGLGLARQRTGAKQNALLTRPDLVLAVHHRLIGESAGDGGKPPSPVETAAWIDRATGD